MLADAEEGLVRRLTEQKGAAVGISQPWRSLGWRSSGRAGAGEGAWCPRREAEASWEPLGTKDQPRAAGVRIGGLYVLHIKLES